MQQPISISAAAEQAPTTSRLRSIDALKVICCVCIIILHALVSRVEHVDTSAVWLLTNLISAATRQAVPVFFMISGALCLRKDVVSYSEYFKNILRRYVTPLFGGLIAYKLLAISQGDTTFFLNTVVYHVGNNLGFHLWFMWTFLGLVLVAPLLRPMVTDRRALRLFIVLWLVFCIVQPWLRPLGVVIPVENTLFTLFAGYFVLGYFLFTSPRRIPGALLVGGILIAVLGTAGLTARGSLAQGTLDARFYTGASPLLVLYGACFFKLFLQGLSGPSSPRLRAVAAATFTIYIYHILALSGVSRLIGPTSLPISLFVYTPLVFAGCLALHRLGRRIPPLRPFFRG